MNEISTNYSYNNGLNSNSDYQQIANNQGYFQVNSNSKASEIEQGITSILFGIGHLIKAFIDTKSTSTVTPSTKTESDGMIGKIGDFANIFGSATDIISLVKDVFTNPIGLLGKVTKFFK